MTSYTFINKCGVCHPGGGPLEYDRNNLRYDKVMADSSINLTEGDQNTLDGDYYKAKWLASGVIEADCWLCHLPQYNNKIRVEQIGKFNYRYAALAGSEYGKVTGSVVDNQPVMVSYNVEMFNADGTVEPNIVKEPRNTACLFCHAKPGYKKRGADFTDRNDVHLNVGLKCVDCHPAGNMATDERIKGKEEHQFAKGDDPGGLVRDDLDNTMRTCVDCHDSGYLGASPAKHNWLPPLHLEKISCQACHIPERYVKSAHYVASDLFNPGTKIPTKGKHLWTFYGPDMNYWNHYGDLEMMGYEDKPTFQFKPELVRYKGQIFPVNRIHSSFPGILVEGIEGLMQPKMSDIYKMWDTHLKDSLKYQELLLITDDSGDGVSEVNRSEEIDALIKAVSKLLADTNYPMEGKQVVWVMNDRVYTSGNDYVEIPIRDWEAAAFGNVHKYNHDIQSAKSAIGSNGCTDCHAFNSSFFFAQTLEYPFDENGLPVTGPQYKRLGISGFLANMGAFRESIVKPVVYLGMATLVIFLLIFLLISNLVKNKIISEKQQNLVLWGVSSGVLAVGIFGYFAGDLSNYMFPTRMFMDANHFMFSMAALFFGVLFYLRFNFTPEKKLKLNLFSILILIAIISGILMLLKFEFIKLVISLAYTLFDLSLVGILAFCVFYAEKLFTSKVEEAA